VTLCSPPESTPLEAAVDPPTSHSLLTSGDAVEWEHYCDGGWNTFSPAASVWLMSAMGDGNADLEEEPRGHFKKKASQRRIRCSTDDDSLSWSAQLRFFLIKAPLLKKLKAMA
jgi:hypothetical protein